MAKQVYRLLRGYTLDPGFSTRLDTMGINETTYRIRWEDMSPSLPDTDAANQKLIGPQGEYFEVVDVDPSSDCYYEPVNLDSIEVLSQNGLKPSEGNPQFHQQFVYTIAMKTLELFEQSLGRPIIWSARKISKTEEQYVKRIRLYPHAIREANAYYSTEKKSILFGYFKAALQIQGTNFPGGSVFACLSPDIISHEVTHALLDSIHPRYLENTNRDVPAFHEGFADIIALLQRFTNTDLLINQLSATGGSLDKFNFLGELATQVGTALIHGRGALRSAIGSYNADGKWERRKPDPTLYQTSNEPHERGSILVVTFFDALIKVYNYKAADMLRIASNGTGILATGAISPDLAGRLAQEVCNIAQHLLKIAIRALDYCPPVDITFGDFLRALVTADVEFAKADENNYRIALIDAFRSWGIFPDLVNTLSEESLQWSSPDLTATDQKYKSDTFDFLNKRVLELTGIKDRAEIWNRSKRLQAELHEFLVKKDIKPDEAENWESWLNKLGLTSNAVNFFEEGKEINQNDINNIPIEIHKIRPVYRVDNQGLVLEQVIVTITQSVTVTISTANQQPETIKFRGGSTIIYDRSKDFKLSYIITKGITSQRRFLSQLHYQQVSNGQETSFTDSMYDENTGCNSINFAHLHFH